MVSSHVPSRGVSSHVVGVGGMAPFEFFWGVSSGVWGTFSGGGPETSPPGGVNRLGFNIKFISAPFNEFCLLLQSSEGFAEVFCGDKSPLVSSAIFVLNEKNFSNTGCHVQTYLFTDNLTCFAEGADSGRFCPEMRVLAYIDLTLHIKLVN